MWLDRYHNSEIEIHYLVQSGFKDRGRLMDSGDNWLELLKQSGETLLVPISAVRVLKVIELESSVENTLLRPAADIAIESEAVNDQ